MFAKLKAIQNKYKLKISLTTFVIPSVYIKPKLLILININGPDAHSFCLSSFENRSVPLYLYVVVKRKTLSELAKKMQHVSRCPRLGLPASF